MRQICDCLVCSKQYYLNYSFILLITHLLRNKILSRSDSNRLFIFFLRPVIRFNLCFNRCSNNDLEIQILLANNLLQRFLVNTGVCYLLSRLPIVSVKVINLSIWLHTRCNLNPQKQPLVVFYGCVIDLDALLVYIRLLLHTTIGIESIKAMPVVTFSTL